MRLAPLVRHASQIPPRLGPTIAGPLDEELDGRLEVTLATGLNGDASNAHGTRLAQAGTLFMLPSVPQLSRGAAWRSWSGKSASLQFTPAYLWEPVAESPRPEARSLSVWNESGPLAAPSVPVAS